MTEHECGFDSGSSGCEECIKAERKRILELIDKFEEETFGNKKQIINEADLQSGEIEFSLTGELFPVEILQGELEALKKEISEVEK